MNVLGIHYGHNATLCLLRNGNVIFCQSEERLNRIKNSTGIPEKTLEYLYKNVISPHEIDLAVFFQKSIYGYLALKERGFKPFQHGYYLDPSLNHNGLRQLLLRTRLGWKLQNFRTKMIEKKSEIRSEANQYFSNSVKLPEEKIKYLDHHLAHAYSALPNIQNWEDALIFTLDGQGDWICATVNLYKDGEIRVLSRVDHHNSLGYYYSCTTSILGMKAGEHEFKVMGLAPYAKSRYYNRILEKLRELLGITENGEWKSAVNPAKLLESLENIYRYQRFDNIAGAIQELTEELILRWILFWVRKTGCQNIALAGGVFMNVKVCQKVAELNEFQQLFVVPSGADESTAIGCAVWGSKTYDPKTEIQSIRDLYLGMEFNNRDVEKSIDQADAKERYFISVHQDINEEVGKLLAKGKIVARCSGRMEFGARALGNRSILADPSKLDNLRIINEAIKSRDFWMPFCPSILEEDMPRYIKNCERIFAPYMCITFNSTEEAKSDIKAAIHPKDFTVRPQCVRREWGSDYYEIIATFKKMTGIGAVLNTSFNLHGEPVVCSPYDAINTVDNSGLEYLTMGNYLLVKKNKKE
jgi:carbamoyltransferase